MKPKFRLQRVLDLRARREEAVGIRLAQAHAAVETAREAEESLLALRTQALLSGPLGGRTATVGQLQNASFVLNRLDQQIDDARARVRAAENRVKECLTEFREATRDRQVLDRLKEKKLEAALLEEADVDRKTMDAIALTRFARSDASAEGSAE